MKFSSAMYFITEELMRVSKMLDCELDVEYDEQKNSDLKWVNDLAVRAADLEDALIWLEQNNLIQEVM